MCLLCFCRWAISNWHFAFSVSFFNCNTEPIWILTGVFQWTSFAQWSSTKKSILMPWKGRWGKKLEQKSKSWDYSIQSRNPTILPKSGYGYVSVNLPTTAQTPSISGLNVGTCSGLYTCNWFAFEYMIHLILPIFCQKEIWLRANRYFHHRESKAHMDTETCK